VPDYDFRSLSPIDFEVFVRDLLNAELGLKLESFAVGPDGGIDLRDVNDSKTTIVQCKHRPDIKKRGLVRSAAAEAKRWPKAPAEMDSYHFVVSGDLTPGAVDATVTALKPLPVEASGVWHRGSLNAALARHPEVERDHFKLWLSGTEVLDRITNAAQWQRSEALLTQVKDRVRLYVHTPAYGAAMELLDSEHVLIIAGPPGVGKSTLAEMILLTMWQDGWTVINIASDIDEAWSKVRGGSQEPEKVVFYYDDFLGQANLVEVQKNEAGGMALLLDTIRKSNSGLRLVVTSREQILNQARAGADDRLRRLANDRSRFRIELAEIDRSARARMLFNHVHFGFPDPSQRRLLAVDTRYRDIIDHRGFNPRVLESVVLRQHHASVDSLYEALLQALEHPAEIWAGSFQQLSGTAMEILFHLATTPSPSVPVDRVRLAAAAPDPREWESALRILEGTWVRLQTTDGVVSEVSLFDPSRRDFLLDLMNDKGYFEFAVTRLKRVEQLHYLLQLSGFIGRTTWRPRRHIDAQFEQNVQELLPRVDGLLVGLAIEEWARLDAWQAELTRIEAADAAEAVGRLVFLRIDTRAMTARLELLNQLAEVCFRSQVAAESLKTWVKDLLESDGTDFKPGSGPYVSPVLKLAETLACDDAPDWSIHYATKLAIEILPSIGGTDEIGAFGQLPDRLLARLDADLVSEELTRALEEEATQIRDETDREIATAWLEEVVSFAHMHDLELDVQDLEDHIAQLPHLSRDYETAPAAIKDLAGPSEGSDEDLANLFAKLG